MSEGSYAETWGVPLVETHASIGSTNDRALELAADPKHELAVVIADEQTKGRGRRGATWHSPPGYGLWMSAVLPHVGQAPWLTLLVGLAAAEAVEEAVPRIRVGIKWPNDLIVSGRKLGGVLCESAGAAVVAGIGINLRDASSHLPPDVRDRSTSLERESGIVLANHDLAAFIVRSLKRRIGPGSALDARTLSALAARDALVGGPVHTDEHGRGIARGIDATGALLLERPDGSRVGVVAGSVRAL